MTLLQNNINFAHSTTTKTLPCSPIESALENWSMPLIHSHLFKRQLRKQLPVATQYQKWVMEDLIFFPRGNHIGGVVAYSRKKGNIWV